jgi:hypothetical protein
MVVHCSSFLSCHVDFYLVTAMYHKRSTSFFRCTSTSFLKKPTWTRIISFYVGEISTSLFRMAHVAIACLLFLFHVIRLCVFYVYREDQECQKIFAAKYPMKHDDCQQKVRTIRCMLNSC